MRKASNRPARNGASHINQRVLYSEWTENFDDGRQSCAGCWFCVLQLLEAYRLYPDDDNDGIEWEPAYLLGIILEPVDLSQRLYRRVGLFVHPWGKYNTSQTKELCPEFADVARLEDMEQEEVTII